MGLIDANFAVDFKAFYCAGSALAAGHDPYRYGSLAGCEQALATFPDSAFRNAVLPAPLPPYALLAYAAPAHLPFAVAVAFSTALNLVCLVVAVRLLAAALPQVPPARIAGVLLIASLPAGIMLGEPTGIALLGVVASGIALRRGSGALMAAALLAVSVQPHVAVPVFGALVVAGGRTARRTAIAVTAFLLAISLAFRPLSLEYLSAVLPLHAHTGIFEFTQLGLPSALAALGVPVTTALTAGSLAYLLALLAGVAVGARAVRRGAPAEYLPWIAVAVAIPAAPHLHGSQLVCALPAAASLALRPRAPILARCAVHALAIPWLTLMTATWGPLVAIASGTAELGGPRLEALKRATLLSVTALVVLVGAVAFCFHAMSPPLVAIVGGTQPDALAEQSWSAVVLAGHHLYGAGTLPPRALTWCAELTLAVTALLEQRAVSVPSRRTSPVAARC